MQKKLSWSVRLGQAEWSRFTYARAPGDSLRLLGSARRGMQLGALGLTEDGQYVYVVGDHITPLPTTLIKKAIARAELFERNNPEPHWQSQRPAGPPATVPVVTIKRRRIPVSV